MAHLPPWSTLAALTLLQMGVGLFVFYGLVPYLIFPRQRGTAASTLMQRAVWMTFLTVAAVHFLTLAGMYSVFSLLAVYAAVALVTLSRTYDGRARRALWYGFLALLGELADGRLRLSSLLHDAGRSLLAKMKGAARQVGWGWAGAFLLLAMLALAAWTRFVPAFQSASIPFSDAPVDLAWMKYLSLQILYHDKIYPRGLYAFMSSLSLLSGANPIILLRLMYPGLSVLVVAAAAYLVYRATDSLAAGAVAALLLGVSHFLPYASIGLFQGPFSQQFGTVFALLFVTFTIQYLRHGRASDLWTTALAGGLTAFVHPIPVALVVVTAPALLLAGLIAYGRLAAPRLLAVVVGTVLAAGLAVLPVVIALLSGQAWHTASLTFLGTTTGTAGGPSLPAVDLRIALLIAATALLFLILALLTRKRRDGRDFSRHFLAAAAALALGFPFAIPYLGLPSFVLAMRSFQSLMIAAAVDGGLIWAVAEALLGRRALLTIPATAALLAAGLTLSPPKIDDNPFFLPTYYAAPMVYGVLRAEATFEPQSWTLVTGPSGYALAFGGAYHQYPNSFLAMVRSLPSDPARWVKAARRLHVGVSQNYVLMAEKTVPDAGSLPTSEVRTRLAWGRMLTAWVARNRARLDIRLVSDTRQLETWTFSIPVDP